MAKKVGVVRKGRTVDLGTKKGEQVRRKNFGPGAEVELDAEEYERLFKAGVVAAKGSEEAQVAKASADQLPEGFPGLEALKKEGIATYSALEEVEDLVELKGIGEATAADIEEALEEREE